MDAILDILEDLKPGEDYRSRTDLVDARVLDSLTILALVSELEETFDIAIPAVARGHVGDGLPPAGGVVLGRARRPSRAGASRGGAHPPGGSAPVFSQPHVNG